MTYFTCCSIVPEYIVAGVICTTSFWGKIPNIISGVSRQGWRRGGTALDREPVRFMTWIFVTIIIVSAGYLTHMIIAFLYRLSALRPRVEILEREIEGQEAEAERYEIATVETEQKAGALEVEVLRYERQISELQARTNAANARAQKASKSEVRAPENRGEVR